MIEAVKMEPLPLVWPIAACRHFAANPIRRRRVPCNRVPKFDSRGAVYPTRRMAVQDELPKLLLWLYRATDEASFLELRPATFAVKDVTPVVCSLHHANDDPQRGAWQSIWLRRFCARRVGSDVLAAIRRVYWVWNTMIPVSSPTRRPSRGDIL